MDVTTVRSRHIRWSAAIRRLREREVRFWRILMTQLRQVTLSLLASAAMLISMLAVYLNAQTSYPPPNEGLPNPYRAIPNWAKLPDGRSWGATAGVAVAPNGSIWAVERCGANEHGC